jgi:hypothetical protein
LGSVAVTPIAPVTVDWANANALNAKTRSVAKKSRKDLCMLGTPSEQLLG